ncbi:uncharacterized protein LOC132789706 isoform X2 [Drosophila nasuta]|uniref:Uncharacterized protein LOC117570307 isoform X1 n=1 Tax=Drosophila albomicans TaxID=7291 RepID=A0A6P8X8V8_DROAB|nr:uncharacterized protein LOC117570307 isoform X1 [Drosophila albomicans]XP_060653888.1 uncharacterized protein LOC132789706 isoform X2 [Drosophila nasuta]
MPVDVSLYIVYFILLVIVCILVRLCCVCAMQKSHVDPPTIPMSRRDQPRVLRQIRIDPSGASEESIPDRQNNIELGRQNNRYGDIFFIEPNSQEAARIREQLEKDEKDLPSYDEVMRMCNLTTPTAAAAASPSVPTSPVVETGPIGIVALPAPPYSETDPNPSSIVVSPSALESAPSTSRAAQIPA